MALTPEHDAYLREHQLCVLATSRRDGSPQLSTVIYSYDGTYVTLSVTTDRAKWANALRQPKVALLVPDGRRQLVAYGTAEPIGPEHPDRISIWRHHRALQGGYPAELWGGTRPLAPPADDAAYAGQLDETKRVLLRIAPTRVLMDH